jgi:hypothetical protein
MMLASNARINSINIEYLICGKNVIKGTGPSRSNLLVPCIDITVNFEI